MASWWLPGDAWPLSFPFASAAWKPNLMSSLDELFEKASRLSEQERATLAGLLIESLEGEADPGVEQAWLEEVQRRLAEIDSGAVKTIPWQTVRRNLIRRLGKP